MIGILLITHAHVASETKAAVEHILGKQTHFEAIDIVNSDTSCKEEIKLDVMIENLDDGEGVLVLVDLMGATPWNMTESVSKGKNIELIAGFNMPAVIKAVSLRVQHVSLKELALASVDSGCKYMCLNSKREALKAS